MLWYYLNIYFKCFFFFKQTKPHQRRESLKINSIKWDETVFDESSSLAPARPCASPNNHWILHESGLSREGWAGDRSGFVITAGSVGKAECSEKESVLSFSPLSFHEELGTCQEPTPTWGLHNLPAFPHLILIIQFISEGSRRMILLLWRGKFRVWILTPNWSIVFFLFFSSFDW